VKVDREERPDLDDIYMDAVQMLTGRGGWPMSVWLTPDLEPFFGGTYFPPLAGRGMPGFLPLLLRIAELWKEKRDEVVEQARQLSGELRRQAEVRPGDGLPPDQVFDSALGELRRTFDPRWGGFGPAPKFPAHLAVELILRRGSPEDRSMAIRTLDAMREGGIYDHLGGGFSRYSVDERWLIPHFEKMLYDNAQLIGCYLSAHQATGNPAYAAVARESLDYLLRDMRDASGGFHSSEDADSEGVEGKFYAFTPGEVAGALGAEEGALFCAAFGITETGNFEHGSSIPHLFSRPAGLPEDRLAGLRDKLLAFRNVRVRPGKDDKVLASWNGLILGALARGFQVLQEDRYLAAASDCAAFIRGTLWTGEGLLRVWRNGRAHTPAFLEDYAAVADGLVDLYEADFQEERLRFAELLVEAMLRRFEDAEQGGFYATEAGQGDLLLRLKPAYDGAVPSGNTLAARALLRLATHLGREDFRASAVLILQVFSASMGNAPRAFLGMLGTLDLAVRGPLEVTLAGNPGEEASRRLLQVVRGRHLPRLAVSASENSTLPLHRGKTRVGGRPAAYVCREKTCAAPATEPEQLARLLA
jgi:uncharacterized protein YyaL (SSP411 family)